MEWESLDTLRSVPPCAWWLWVQVKRSPPPSTVTFWRETSAAKRPKVTENNPSDGTVSVEAESEISDGLGGDLSFLSIKHEEVS